MIQKSHFTNCDVPSALEPVGCQVKCSRIKKDCEQIKIKRSQFKINF